MKRLLILCIFLVLGRLTLLGQCSTFEQFYNIYPDYNGGHTIISTKDGGFFSVSSGYNDTLNPGPHAGVSFNVLMEKTDACGNRQWQKAYGLVGQYDEAASVVEDDDGEFIIAGESSNMQSSSNMHAVKYTKDGGLIWDKVYSGIQPSSGRHMIKRPGKDRYLIVGEIDYGNISKGLLVEIDGEGIEKRSKALYHPIFDGAGVSSSIRRIFPLGDSAYLSIISTTESIYFVKTDTLFNILSVKDIISDTIEDLSIFYDATLSFDKQHIGLTSSIKIEGDWKHRQHVLKFDLSGEIVSIYSLPPWPSDTIAANSYIIPTNDNGFLVGWGMLKLDSTFNFQWYKESRGYLYSAIQLQDNSFVLSGVSGWRTTMPDSTWIDELYIVKTDSTGNFIRTGIEESYRFTTNLKFTVYPNPASDQIKINTGLSRKYTVGIFDITGKKMIQTSLIDDSETINTSSLPQGMYVVQLLDNNQTITASQKLSVLR